MKPAAQLAETAPLCEALPPPLEGAYADMLKAHDTVPFAFDMGDGRTIYIERLMFHWTVKIARLDDWWGYEDRFCYNHLHVALYAIAEWRQRGWDGEPLGWHRHPKTGRRRPDGDPSKEYVEA